MSLTLQNVNLKNNSLHSNHMECCVTFFVAGVCYDLLKDSRVAL